LLQFQTINENEINLIMMFDFAGVSDDQRDTVRQIRLL